MSVKVNTDGLKEKIKRMEEIKKITPTLVLGATKKNASNFIKSFAKWIKQDQLDLDHLAESTIANKEAWGMSKPNVPLYGEGDSEKPFSYNNMLRLRKIKGGWKVSPSKAKHWSGKITLDHLFAIHEYGCKIKRGKSITQIPARPALKNSFNKFTADEKNKPEKLSAKIAQMSKRYLKDGNKKVFELYTSEIAKNQGLIE